MHELAMQQALHLPLGISFRSPDLDLWEGTRLKAGGELLPVGQGPWLDVPAAQKVNISHGVVPGSRVGRSESHTGLHAVI